MRRAYKPRLPHSTYFGNVLFQIFHVFYTVYQRSYQPIAIPLPIEIWQRISAFWVQDLLSLDMSVDKIDTIIGCLFEHMDDFIPITCNTH